MHAEVSGMEGHGCDCRPAVVEERVKLTVTIFVALL